MENDSLRYKLHKYETQLLRTTKSFDYWAMAMNTGLFYKSKPVFGFDIGHGTIKVAQFSPARNGMLVQGYGFATFDAKAIKDGVIENLEVVAQSAHGLLTNSMIGAITTNRAALSLPVSQSFTKILELPKLKKHELDDAVNHQVEQYVPVPFDQLYIDYEITNRSFKDEESGEVKQEVVMVAAKKTIVDSYLKLFEVLGLEIELIETTTSAIMRAVRFSQDSNKPVVVIDFGSKSCDLTVYDENIRVTSTVDVGGESVTSALVKGLGISEKEAYAIKSKYGLGPSKQQQAINKALEPILKQIVSEINKVIRYHDERSKGAQKIDQIVTIGGGSNMPGLREYIAKQTKLETLAYDPWKKIDFGSLQRPHPQEAFLYTTATGSALWNPGGNR